MQEDAWGNNYARESSRLKNFDTNIVQLRRELGLQEKLLGQ